MSMRMRGKGERDVMFEERRKRKVWEFLEEKEEKMGCREMESQ